MILTKTQVCELIDMCNDTNELYKNKWINYITVQNQCWVWLTKAAPASSDAGELVNQLRASLDLFTLGPGRSQGPLWLVSEMGLGEAPGSGTNKSAGVLQQGSGIVEGNSEVKGL